MPEILTAVAEAVRPHAHIVSTANALAAWGTLYLLARPIL
jgi:hypothetical protein